tara:strand:- start:119 stop:883 length:765 start_codon:yes stop_codon:yes gene_type:complete
VKESHAVIELVDARAPKSSSNPTLKPLIRGLPRIILLTKGDLADPETTKLWQNFIESKLETKCLINDYDNPISVHKFLNELKSLVSGTFDDSKQKQIIVTGIPNVGKSTLLNAIVGKKVANTGNEPAVTRTQQRTKVAQGWYLIDTPGLLWPKLENQENAQILACLGTIRNTAINIEETGWFLAEILKQDYPDLLKTRYGIETIPQTIEALYESIALRTGSLSKKGYADYHKVSQTLLNDFRSGRLGRFSLEKP